MDATDQSFPRGRVTKPESATAGAAKGEREEFLFDPRRGQAAEKHSKKDKKSKKSKAPAAAAVEAQAPPVAETLRHKTVVPGVSILGVVHRVAEDYAIISLPHQLSGIVRSENATNNIERTADGTPVRVSMNDVVRVGQYVRCHVLSVSSADGKRKQLSLAILPEVANRGLSFENFAEGSVVWGSIKSVEDHGYIIDTGIDNCVAFLPREAASNADAAQLCAGRLLCTMVDSINKTVRTLRVKYHPTRVTSKLADEPSHTLQSLKPGMLVKSTILKVLPNGLFVNFLGFFQATIDMGHLSVPPNAFWAKKFKPGKNLKVRLMFINPTTKQILASAAPHVLAMTASPIVAESGEVYNDCVITRVDPKVGLFLRLRGLTTLSLGDDAAAVTATTGTDAADDSSDSDADETAADAEAGGDAEADEQEDEEDSLEPEWGRMAFVHVSRISKDRIDHFERKYKVGQLGIRARVVSSARFDGILAATMEPTIVNASVLKPTDLQAGQLVEATVSKIDKKGIFTTLGPRVKGVIPAMHYADVMGTKMKARFKVGQKIKCRVLTINPARRSVQLTRKRTLIESKLPILTTYEQVRTDLEARYRPGTLTLVDGAKPLIVHAFVTGISAKGVIVTMFSNVHGIVNRDDLLAHRTSAEKEADGDEPSDTKLVQRWASHYTLGSVVKVRVVDCDPSRGRMSLSFHLRPSASDQFASRRRKRGDVAEMAALGVTVGEVVDATVVDLESVVEDTKRVPTTTSVFVKLEVDGADVFGELPLEHLSDHMQVAGQVRPVYTAGRTMKGLLVIGSKQIGGRHGRQVALLSQKPLLLQAAVNRRAALASGETLDKDVLTIPASFEECQTGSHLAGYVTSITSFGIFVRFLNNLTGLVPSSKLADTPIDDPAAVYVSGQTIRVRVEAVNVESHKCILTSAPSALQSAILSDRALEHMESALYLRSLLQDQATAAAIRRALEKTDEHDDEADTDAATPAANGATEESGSDDDEAMSDSDEEVEGEEVVASRAAFPLGTEVWAEIDAVKDYGIILTLPGDVTGFAVQQHIDSATSYESGQRVRCRVLDVDTDKGIVDVSLLPRLSLETLLAAQNGTAKKTPKKSKRKRDASADVEGLPTAPEVGEELPAPYGLEVHAKQVQTLAVGDETTVTVELLRRGALGGYAVVSANGVVGLAAVGEYHIPSDKVAAVTGVEVPALLSHAKAIVTYINPSGIIMFSLLPALVNTGAAVSARRTRRVPDGSTDALLLTPGAFVSIELLEDGQTALDRAKSAAKGKHGGHKEEESDDEEAHHASLPPYAVAVRLTGVHGPCRAHLHFAELMNFNWETGVFEGTGSTETQKSKKSKKSSKTSSVEVDQKTAVEACKSALKEMKSGQAVRAKIVSAVHATQGEKTTVYASLTLRAADLALSEGKLACLRPSLNPPTTVVAAPSGVSNCSALRHGVVAGATSWGVVEGTSPQWVWVGLGGGVSAKMHILESGVTMDQLAKARGSLHRLFPMGTRVHVVVLSHAKDHVTVSASKTAIVEKAVKAAGAKTPEDAIEAAAAALQHAERPQPGQVTLAWVCPPHTPVVDRIFSTPTAGEGDSLAGSWLRVRIPFRLQSYGNVCVTQAADRAAWTDQPFANFNTGDVVEAVVVDVPKKRSQAVHLSFRPSLIQAAKLEASKGKAAGEKAKAWLDSLESDEVATTVTAGAVLPGYVQSISSKGCFIKLTRTTNARVLLSNLSDGFVHDIQKSFPPGKLVAGRVTSIDAKTSRVEMTLKPSQVTGQAGGIGSGKVASSLTRDTLKTGMCLNGRVANVTEYGVFVELLGPRAASQEDAGSDSDEEGEVPTGIKGLVHVSQVSDARVDREKLPSMFSMGDPVRVYVSTVEELPSDGKKQKRYKVALSMKASHFLAEMGQAEPTKKSDKAAAEESEESGSEDEEMSGSESGSVDESVDAEALADQLMAGDSDSDDEGVMKIANGATEEGSSDEEEEGSSDSDDSGSDSDDDSSDDDNHVEAAALPSAGFDFGAASASKQKKAADDDDSDSSDDSDTGDADKKLGRRARATQRRMDEEEVERREKELVAGNILPETPDDFEKLVIASPNNSFLWIQYMAHLLSITEVAAARAVAQRALKTISFRDEQEKLNVWVAYLNLEHQYGNDEHTASVFAEALKLNDPKTVYLKMQEIYARTGANDKAIATLKTACTKFSASRKIWLTTCQQMMKSGDAEGARKQFTVALTKLARHKHVRFIQAFAIMEYADGNQERGRTMFENLISTYPKKLDIWGVYLDQEIAAGDLEATRRLFERAITLTLSSKKMKFLFKKYMTFEAQHGDEAGVEHVKEAARQYVSKQTS